jgi:L,D-transpeptidase ErfK/SrfK
MKNQKIKYFILVLCFIPGLIFANSFSVKKEDTVVGKTLETVVKPGQDITDIGLKYDVGYFEFLESNPNENLRRLNPGTRLIVPTQYILPAASRKGIVINVAELRLYYYPTKDDLDSDLEDDHVMTFPIGIGRQGDETPLIKSKIISKKENPAWRPTAKALKESLERGIVLPKVIEPGPQNPLGDYAMRLSSRSYLIHGTNDASGVGLRSSAGCIRMYPEDAKLLFSLVKIGTPVNIVDQPFKIGWIGNKLYLEVHIPLEHKGEKPQDILEPVVALIMDNIKVRRAEINWEKAFVVIKEQKGIPEVIGMAY